jgi:hypothetical protein
MASKGKEYLCRKSNLDAEMFAKEVKSRRLDI